MFTAIVYQEYGHSRPNVWHVRGQFETREEALQAARDLDTGSLRPTNITIYGPDDYRETLKY
jgi:hypothetical protein